MNPYEDITELRQYHLSINLLYTDTCAWSAIQSFEVVCNAEVTLNPFDTEICTLKFYISGYLLHDNDLVIFFINGRSFLSRDLGDYRCNA